MNSVPDTIPSEASQNANRVATPLPSVNFYILADSDLQKRLQFVFRLVEKAFDQQLKTLVIGADDAQLVALDKLIWTAKPARFISHERLENEISAPFPSVLLTDGVSRLTGVPFAPDVVIDLSYDGTPLNFPKILLVANQHPEILPNARMKYQAYANAGIQPTVHKIGGE